MSATCPKNMFYLLRGFATALTVVLSVATANATVLPSGITYHGRLLESNGITPVSGIVTFDIQIKSPDSSNCILYEETQTQNLSGSQGVFALTINDGSGTRTDAAPQMSIDDVFSNRTVINHSCGGGPYTPNPGDGRILKVTFQSTTMAMAEPMPDQALNFAPLAIEAKQVSGYAAENILRFENADHSLFNTSPLNNAQYDELLRLVNGTSTAYALSPNATNGTSIYNSSSGTIGSTTVGDMWLDTSAGGNVDVLKINTRSGVQEIPLTAGSFLTSVAPGVGISVSTAGSVATVGIANGGVTAAKLDPAINIGTTGYVSAHSFAVSNSQATPNTIGIYAPIAAFTNYTLVLPNSPGTSGQVLKTDGTGNLSWVDAAAGTLNSAHIFVGNASNVATDVAMTGDVGISTSGVTTVMGLQGVGISTTAPLTGQVLVYNGGVSKWQAQNFSIGSLIGQAGTSQFASATCSSSQTLTWSSLTDTFTCSAIAGLDAGAIATGTIDPARLPAASNDWANNGTAIYNTNTGYVGIGTSTPSALLQIYTPIGTFNSATTTKGIAFKQSGTFTDGAAAGTVSQLLSVNRIAQSTVSATNAITYAHTASFSIEDAPLAGANATLVNRYALYSEAGTNYFGGNVGIGVTAPIAKLDVAGIVRSSTGGFTFPDGTTQTTAAVGAGTTSPWTIYGANIANSNTGNVGIGVTAPIERLDVYGNVRTVYGYGFLTSSNSLSPVLTGKRSDGTGVGSLDYDGWGNFSFNNKLAVGTNTVLVGSSAALYVNGNIGVGTTSPVAPIELFAPASGFPATTGTTDTATGFRVGVAPGTSTVRLDMGIKGGAGASSWLQSRSSTDYSVNYPMLLNPNGGNVGIGTTAPAYSLDVAGPIHTSSGGFTFPDGTTQITAAVGAGTTNPWTTYGANIANNNTSNVGIGTTAPATTLEVAGSARVTATSTGILYPLSVYNNHTNIAADRGSGMAFVGPGTINLGYIGSAFSDGTGTETYMQFSTRTGGVTAEKMRVTAGGNVGIGTTTPFDKLDVTATNAGGTGGRIVVTNPATPTVGNSSEIGFKSSSGFITNYYSSRIASILANTGNDADLAFFTYKNASSPAGGSERLRITSTGNVGIGTSAPATKLDVAGIVRSSTGGFTFPDGTTQITAAVGAGTTNPWTIYGANIANNNTGNVGIGTSTPETKLHIVSTGTSTNLGQLDTNFRMTSNTVTVGAGSEISFKGLPTASDIGTYAAISAPLNTNNAVTGSRGYLAFSTKAAATDTSLSERMRVDSSGYVGIGTTAPSGLLEMVSAGGDHFKFSNNTRNFEYNGGANTVLQYGAYPTTGMTGPGIAFQVAGNNTIEADGVAITTPAHKTLGFGTSNGTAVTERMRIDSAGNVGIGITALAYKLDVAGLIHSSTGGFIFPDGTTQTTAAVGAGTTNPWTAYGTNIANNNTGNVGIGTTAPGAALDVGSKVQLVTGSSYGAIRLARPDGSLTAMGIQGADSTGTQSSLRLYNNSGFQAAIEIGQTIEFFTNSSTTNRMHIDTSGNVGIGTTTPAAKLDVGGAVSFSPGGYSLLQSAFDFTAPTSSGSILRIRNQNAAYNSSYDLTLQTNASAGNSIVTGQYAPLHIYGGPSAPISLQEYGGNVGIGTTTPAAKLDVAGIVRSSTGGFTFPDGTTQTTAAVGAGTTNPWTTYGTNIVNNNTGNVGIGTSSPGALLHVYATADASTKVLAEATSAGTSAQAMFNAKNDLGHAAVFSLTGHAFSGLASQPGDGTYITNPGTGGLNFINLDSASPVRIYTGGGAATNERMRITSAGNVGIGTTAPAQSLSVGNSLQSNSPISSGNLVPRQVQINDLYANTGATVQASVAILAQANAGSNNTAVDYGLQVENVIPSSQTVNYGNKISIQGQAYNVGSGAVGNLRGGQFISTHAGTNTATAGVGVSGGTSNTSTGTVTAGYGGQFSVGNSSTGTVTTAYGSSGAVLNSSTGTIGAAYGIYSGITNGNAGGTITAAYGLYLTKVNSGTITNNYGIYQADTSNNYFGGNIGIGTTAPATKLDVAGVVRSSTGGFTFPDGTTQITAAVGAGTTNPWTTYGTNIAKNNTGSVGIGTTAPVANLEVFNNANGEANIQVTNPNTGTAAVAQFDASNGTSGASFGVAGTNYTTWGAIAPSDALIYSDNNVAITSYGKDIKFGTSSGGVQERMRITSNGSVGIGTTSPIRSLHVQNASGSAQSLTLSNSDYAFGTAGTSLQFAAGAASGSSYYKLQTWTSGESVAGNLVLESSGGNVGIGITAPAYKLDVAGLIHSSTGGFIFPDGTTQTTAAVGAGTTNPWTTYGTNIANNNTGGVGIGTTLPHGKFDVRGSIMSGTTDYVDVVSGSSVVTSLGATTGNTYSQIQAYINGRNNGGVLSLNPLGGNVGIGTTSPGVLLSLGPVTSGIGASKLRLYENGTDAYGFGVSAGTLNIQTGSGGNTVFSKGIIGSEVETMRITSAGNVGIGTTAPVQKLEVNGTSLLKDWYVGSQYIMGNSVADRSIYGGWSGAGAKLNLISASQNWGSTPSEIGAQSRISVGNSANSYVTANGADHVFYTKDSASGTWNEIPLMTIKSAGNIGIGTTVPNASYKLDVAGGINATGLYVNGVAVGTGTSSPWATSGTNIYNSNTGNVGIGTTAPAHLLDVITSAVTAPLYVQSTAASGQSGITLENDRGGLASYGGFVYGGSTKPGNLFGLPRADKFTIFADGASTTGMMLGTLVTQPIILGTNNLERMRIDSSGNIGIGTTAPATKLDVAGVVRSSTGGFTFPDGTTQITAAVGAGTTDPWTAYGVNIANNNTGKVGIGTTSPSSVLDIYAGAGYLSNFRVFDNTAARTVGVYYNNEANPRVGFQQYSSTSGVLSLVYSGGSTTAATSGAAIDFPVNRTLGFDTSNGTAMIERMRIDQSGNVGIGTTAPGVALDVIGAARASTTLASGSSGNNGGLNIYQTSGGLAASINVNGSGEARFTTSNTSAATTFYGGGSELMRIQGTGNVGIGTTAPSAALEIVGDIQNQYGNGLKTKTGAGVVSNLISNNGGDVAMGGLLNNIYMSTGGTQRIKINSTGMAIGNFAPAYKLDVAGDINIATGSALKFNGTDVCTSTGCTSSSDRNLKENIKPLADDQLEKVVKLQGVEYDYKDKARFTDQHQIGVIAQDVEKVYPEVVRTDKKTGLKSVAYDHLVAPLIESVKALYKRIVGIEAGQDKQARELASLKVENAQKDKELEQMKKYLCTKDPKAPFCQPAH